MFSVLLEKAQGPTRGSWWWSRFWRSMVTWNDVGQWRDVLSALFTTEDVFQNNGE
jgi:hypothetical protein